ncbi:NUDIX hydrolase [Marivirga salinae]|uniref:NUDIX hydrolase n=1 Tax=Marivirga salinarum TaxID=3059078 RepID=A0AA49GDF2_9BACT|nr:NUDIX hydrolase [Marivirga sp. BDSF4-3]WKK75190.2 NUDIX hydrolase [Marivirga sp. BDSF4-3]
MEALKQYRPLSEKEEEYKNKMLELYEAKGKKAFSRNNLEAHFTASAWIINSHSKEILLLHHKKLNKWLQPGGHADGETDLEKVARKEVNEETGLENLKLVSNDVYDIDIHLIPENKGIPEHYHYDVRFAYFCESNEKTRINHESNDFQWIKIKEVETLTQEPSILRMVKKSKNLLNGL